MSPFLFVGIGAGACLFVLLLLELLFDE